MSQNYTEKELCHLKQQLIDYLIIYDVIYSLLVLIEKLQVANVYYILQVFWLVGKDNDITNILAKK